MMGVAKHLLAEYNTYVYTSHFTIVQVQVRNVIKYYFLFNLLIFSAVKLSIE